MGVAALALIGTGASATFTDNVRATQSITGGDLEVTLRGPAGTSTSTDVKTVTLADLDPVSSTFTSGPQRVFASNTGNIGAHAVKLSVSAVGDNRVFYNEVYVKIVKWSGANGTGTASVAYNNTLSYLVAHPITMRGPVVAPTGWDQFDVTFYAGREGAPSLTNPSQEGHVTPTITVDYEG